jgi:hypothetical protein
MPITIQFEWTLDEFLEGQRVFNRRLAPTLVRMNHLLAIPVGILLLVDAAAGFALGWSKPLCLLFLFFGVYLLSFRLVLGPRKLKAEYARYPSLDRTMTFDEDRICVQTSLGNSQIDWSDVARFVETKNIFVLFAPPGIFWPIPKRVLSPEEIAELRELFRRKLPAK